VQSSTFPLGLTQVETSLTTVLMARADLLDLNQGNDVDAT